MVKHEPKHPTPLWTKVLLSVPQSICFGTLLLKERFLRSDRSRDYAFEGTVFENHKAL